MTAASEKAIFMLLSSSSVSVHYDKHFKYSTFVALLVLVYKYLCINACNGKVFQLNVEKYLSCLCLCFILLFVSDSFTFVINHNCINEISVIKLINLNFRSC